MRVEYHFRRIQVSRASLKSDAECLQGSFRLSDPVRRLPSARLTLLGLQHQCGCLGAVRLVTKEVGQTC